MYRRFKTTLIIVFIMWNTGLAAEEPGYQTQNIIGLWEVAGKSSGPNQEALILVTPNLTVHNCVRSANRPAEVAICESTSRKRQVVYDGSHDCMKKTPSLVASATCWKVDEINRDKLNAWSLFGLVKWTASRVPLEPIFVPEGLRVVTEED